MYKYIAHILRKNNYIYCNLRVSKHLKIYFLYYFLYVEYKFDRYCTVAVVSLSQTSEAH